MKSWFCVSRYVYANIWHRRTYNQLASHHRHADGGEQQPEGQGGAAGEQTGLPSVAAFLLVLWLAMMVGFSGFKAMTAENTLLVILMKLKMGLRNRDIAYRFRVPVSYVSTILSSRLCHVTAVGRQLIQWPSKEAVQANMPNCFLACGGDLRRTRVIVDCFEIFTERPKALTARAQMWSNYKSHSTVKVLIGISPAGAVIFVSDVWGGRATDKAITLDGNLIDLVEPYDVVLADRGFLVRDEFAVLNVKVVTPHFTRGRKQMTRKEVQESRRISRVRIHHPSCRARHRARAEELPHPERCPATGPGPPDQQYRSSMLWADQPAWKCSDVDVVAAPVRMSDCLFPECCYCLAVANMNGLCFAF